MLGLDQPFYRQYVTYIGKALQGDLGVSFWTKEPVLDEIVRRLPVSLELAVLAMFFGLLIALPTGIFSAVRQDTWLDYLFRSRHRRALRTQLLDGHVVIVAPRSGGNGCRPCATRRLPGIR